MPRRVVFTSLGIVSSLGAFPSQILAVMGEGSPVFERPPFDNDVTVCPIKGFDIRTFTGRYKNLRYLTRGAQFCVASAIQAVKQSGLKAEQIARAGLFVGVGPNLDIGGEFPSIRDGKIDMGFMAALWILKFLPNTAASAISHLAGIHGENSTIGTACSASLQAIGEAFRKVRDGYLDLAFAGGGDSRLTPGGILAYKKAEALWTGQEDCSTTYSPFDAGRKGFVPGEGGAFLLLEHLDHALARGARIYGEICGFGASMDGCSMTAPEPEGAWAEVAVHAALRDAKVAPLEIDVVSAHGTGTVLNDAVEAEVLARTFSLNAPFVIALKSWTGHLAAACGAVELAIALSCMQSSFLPAIRNLKDPCHKNVNFVRKSQTASIKCMLLENFGFGGQNGAIVVKKWNGS